MTHFIKHWAKIGGLIGAFCLAAFATPTLAATSCDHVAGHPDDPDKVVPGFERPEIDLAAAVATCREVLTAMPDHARTNYLLGRVLFYQGKGEEALPYLERAAEAGYRQSIFVLGYLDLIGGHPRPDVCRGKTLLLQGASLDHPWSGYHLVNGTLDGSFDACDAPLSDTQLQRYLALVRDHVTVAASDGRVEALAAKLEQHMSDQEGA